MKPIQTYFEELLARWLHEDFRNPASDMYIGRITTENVAKLITSASNSMTEIILQELDSARKWYAEEKQRIADETLLANPIKRREYEEFLEKEWEELKKEYGVTDDTEEWYKR